MIDKHAPQIVTADGEQSSQTILPCSVNASTDRVDDEGPLKETAASMSGMAAVRFPLPPLQALTHDPIGAVSTSGKPAVRYASRKGLPGG